MAVAVELLLLVGPRFGVAEVAAVGRPPTQIRLGARRSWVAEAAEAVQTPALVQRVGLRWEVVPEAPEKIWAPVHVLLGLSPVAVAEVQRARTPEPVGTARQSLFRGSQENL